MEFKEAISKTLPVEMICRGGVRKWDFSFTPGERESQGERNPCCKGSLDIKVWEAAGLMWVSVSVPEPVPFPLRCESFGRRRSHRVCLGFCGSLSRTLLCQGERKGH